MAQNKQKQSLEKVQEYLETISNKKSKPDVVLEYKQNGFLTKEGNKWIFKKGDTQHSHPITLPQLQNIDTSSIKIYDNSPSWLKTKPKEPKRKPRLLKGMVMTLKGEDVINISFKGDYYAVTPTTLGLMKGGKPTLIWDDLVLLCKNKGVINFPYMYGMVKYLEEKDKYQARLKRLRQFLESEFDVKIKRGRDYNYHNVFEFKSVVFRDEFTPQHEQFLNQQEEDRLVADVTYSALDSIKKYQFHNTELEDEENIQQNF